VVYEIDAVVDGGVSPAPVPAPAPAFVRET